MHFYAATLEEKTQQYWLLSKCRNGKLPQSIKQPNVSEALQTVNIMLQYINPNRAIVKSLYKLQNDIIRNKPRTRKKSKKSTVIQISAQL